MRHFYRAMAGVVLGLVCGSFGMSQPAWGAGPTTAPAVADEGRILVLPFTAINKSEYQPWLGRAIQQSLLADITTAAPARTASADNEASDAAAALAAGRKADAAYVVFGSFATVGQELRVTGQVLDVATGRPMAGLKATGPVGDVFQLEDQLALQVRQRLALGPVPGYRPAMNQPEGAGEQPAPPDYGQANAGPQVYYPQDYGPANYPDYGYPDLGYGAYPGYYGYGYGYPWYGGIVIGEDFGRHRFHDRDGDHDRDDRFGRNRDFGNDPARNYYYGRTVVNGQVLGGSRGSVGAASPRTSPRVHGGGGHFGGAEGGHFGGGDGGHFHSAGGAMHGGGAVSGGGGGHR